MNEKEMDEFAATLAKIPGTPRPIKLRVQYDAALQRITGKDYDPVIMGEGAVFVYLLQNIFLEHPGIESAYPPGALSFEINGQPPKPHTPLFDGDVVQVRAAL